MVGVNYTIKVVFAKVPIVLLPNDWVEHLPPHIVMSRAVISAVLFHYVLANVTAIVMPARKKELATLFSLNCNWDGIWISAHAALFTLTAALSPATQTSLAKSSR